jgi:hypothetical protein
MINFKAKAKKLDAHEKTGMKDIQKNNLSATKKVSKKNVYNITPKGKLKKNNMNLKEITLKELKYQMMKRSSCIIQNYHNDVFLKTGTWANQNYDMSYVKKVMPKNDYDVAYLGYVDVDIDDNFKDSYDVTYIGNININEEDSYNTTYIGYVFNVDDISQ